MRREARRQNCKQFSKIVLETCYNHSKLIRCAWSFEVVSLEKLQLEIHSSDSGAVATHCSAPPNPCTLIFFMKVPNLDRPCPIGKCLFNRGWYSVLVLQSFTHTWSTYLLSEPSAHNFSRSRVLIDCSLFTCWGTRKAGFTIPISS